MRNGLLASFLVLLAGAGAAFAQAPAACGGGHGCDCPPGWSWGVEEAHPYAPACAPQEDDCPPRVWVNGEYLLWWFKGGPIPYPLVLTGPNDNNNPGALNQRGRAAVTDRDIDYDSLSGARLTAGGWLDPDGRLGIEWSGFLLPKQTKNYRFSSDANGSPVLGFRYIDTPFNTGSEDIFQASIPTGNALAGPFSGSVAVLSSTRLWGTELNAVTCLSNGGGLRLQALGGLRYVDLAEDLTLQLQSFAIGGTALSFEGNPVNGPSGVASTDFFRTRNQFYAAQLGLRGESNFGKVVVGVTGKLAVGDMHEIVDIRGISAMIPNPGPITTVPVGQFAGPSNIGRRTRDQFALAPEVEVKGGYQLTSCLRATVGYDILYLSRVVRPGSQVDLVVNDSTNPLNAAFGTAPIDRTSAPRPFFQRTDFWAQGLTFGLELSF